MSKKNKPGSWANPRPSLKQRTTNQKRNNRNKNLIKRDDGTLSNQFGVTFTPEEKKALEAAVRRNNRLREKLLKEESAFPRLEGGKSTGDTVGSLQLMGSESDFIIPKRSASLQRITSREQFEREMKIMNFKDADTLIHDRIKLYKRNHIKAIQSIGGDSKDIEMKIRMMKPEEYRKYVAGDDKVQIWFAYDNKQGEDKLNQIRHSLGMKMKEA